jgi:hypothetical protein
MGHLPYRRWFLYLLIATLWTLARPYFARKDSHIYDPDIQTFTQVDHKTEPTPQHIWIDGRSYEFMDRGWLYFALFVIGVEFCGFATVWISAHRKKKVGDSSLRSE